MEEFRPGTEHGARAGRRVKAPALVFHDVVPRDCFDSSGFPGADANAYKLFIDEFGEHLSAMRARTTGRGVAVRDLLQRGAANNDFLLTFDDGGISAIQHTHPMLAELGWVGHFFITTDYIGKPGFLSRGDIAELARNGHVIGSHSCSHPPIISRCTREQLLREWRESAEILADITGERTTVASIPGGFYSTAVVETAAAAGIRMLFTSEPTGRARNAGGCTVIGRYSIQRGTPPQESAALAAADFAATARQAIFWNIKKPLKAVGGRYWLWFRKRVMARRYAG